jgi:outer membrane protein assembly factor BamE
MQKLITLLVVAMLALSVAGCHIAYTPDVQQGNLLDKKMVDQLKPGMTKHQVLVLMGTPSVSTPFDQSRWDYVSTQSRRGGPMDVRTFTLTFNNDTLVRTAGDFFSKNDQQLVKESEKYNAGYPATETRGDKSESPKDEHDDGGFGQEPPDNGH